MHRDDESRIPEQLKRWEWAKFFALSRPPDVVKGHNVSDACFEREDVSEVIHQVVTGDWDDDKFGALVRLNDGRFACLGANCVERDFSMWVCVASTLEAVRKVWSEAEETKDIPPYDAESN